MEWLILAAIVGVGYAVKKSSPASPPVRVSPGKPGLPGRIVPVRRVTFGDGRIAGIYNVQSDLSILPSAVRLPGVPGTPGSASSGASGSGSSGSSGSSGGGGGGGGTSSSSNVRVSGSTRVTL